jgi:tetratricopeptide (TPR) repeat protein
MLAAVWLGSCAAGRPAPNAPTRGATRQPGPPSAGQFAQDTPPLSSEATFHYLRAVLLLEDGNPPAAVEAAKEALVFDGGSAVLHALLARALLAAGRTGEALAASEKALSLAPEAVDVQRVRVDVLWRAGRRADAESLLKRLQHATPGDVAVASMLMEVQLARGDLVAAQRSQQVLVQGRPQDPDAALALARACLERGRLECATAEAEGAARRFPRDPAVCAGRAALLDRAARFVDSANAWRVCVALEPDQPAHRAAVVVALARAGQGRAAQAEASLANPADLPALAHALLEDGQPALARAVLAPLPRGLGTPAGSVDALAGAALGQCAAADAALAAVSSESAWYTPAVTARVACSVRAALPLAAKDLEQAALVLPAADQPLLCRAWVRAGKPQRALQRGAALAQVDPAAQAVCLSVGGDVQGARAVLQRALGAAPEDPAVLNSVVVAFTQMDAPAEALQAARAWLAVAPEDPTAKNVTAYLLVRTAGDAKEAVRLATAAAAARPDSAELADTLGVALLAAGDVKAGLPLLEAAAARLPADPEVLLHLGDALAAHGQLDRAAQAWTTARALLPLDDHVARALAQRRTAP